MKKNLSKFRFALLGIFMCLISVCAIGQTERTYSYTFTKCVWSSLGTQSIGGWTWTASGTSTGSYFGSASDKGQQFGSSSAPFTALTLSTNSIKGTVTSVKVNTSGANGTNATFEVKVGGTKLMYGESSTISLTKTATEYEFTGTAEAGAIELVWEQTSSRALYIKSIEVTYTPDPSFVDAPTFTPESGSYYEPASVVLETIAEGATIYYTIDGTEPSTSSLLYQEPIAVEQTTTIKAIAVRDTNSSEVSTAVYSFPINVNSIAAFKSQGVNNGIYKLTTTAKVIYNNPTQKYLFIQDETGALVMYSYTGATYNAGDEITGSIYGTYSLYNGMNEMVFKAGTPALPEATAGTPVDAIEATIAQLKNNYAYYEGRLVTVKNVTFIGNKRFVQGEDTMAFHTQLATFADFEAGVQGNITGLMVYNSTKPYPYQLFPRSVNDIELPATLPYFVDFDQFVDSHLAINNGENVNKWYIGQAQDFDNNKLYISSTNGLTNKYDNTATSTVTVTRDIIIPAVGAVVSFDYHVNGESGSDYMQVAIGDLQVRLPQTDGWENYTMEIPASMAGVQTLTLTWHNDCSAGEQFPAAIDNISIHTPVCVNPSGLQANVDNSSVTITWTPGEATQNTFVAEYKLEGHDMWNSHNVEGNTVTFANLQGNSEYQVRVKAVCGEVSSNWIETTFMTPCQNVTYFDTLTKIGTGNTNTSNVPIYCNDYNSYTQVLYTESELAAQGIVPGTIISTLDYNYYWANSMVRPVNIYLGTTDATSLSSAFVSMNTLTQVFTSDCYPFSNENNNWVSFTFTQPFTYTGGNLIVATLSDTTSETTSECFTQKSGTSRFKYTNVTNRARFCSDPLPISFNENGMPVADGTTLPGTSNNHRVNVRFGATVPECQDTELCADMVSLTVLDETSTTATLKWVGAQGQNNFKLELIAEGAENQIFTVSTDTNVVEYELTGLNPLTSYTVNVWANCGVDQNSNKKTTSFTTDATCPSVTNIVTSNMSNTTTVTWQVGSNETAWNVQFKKTSEGDNAWISLPLVQVLPSTTFGGLVGNTDYIIRVQPVCEGAAAWEYQHFTSGCASATIPYNITFGSSAVTEANVDCWLNNGFTEYASYYSATQAGAEMISQALVIPTTGDYYVVFNVNGNYEISASSMGTRADRFSTLERGYMNGRVVILIPDIYKGKTVYFKLTNDANARLQLRKMEVTTCPNVPTTLTCSNITANSIDLAWTADESDTNFQVKVVDVLTSEETIIDVIGNTTTVNNLVYGNTYNFFVRTNCGIGQSEWYGPVSKKIEISLVMGEQASATTCVGMLYDNGGPDGDYSSRANDVMVINPASENSVIRLQGPYNTEANCDHIYVYDGVGTEGTQLYKVNGTGNLDVTSTLGALTVKFTSDYSRQYSGFALAISCEPAPACADPRNLAFNGITSTLTWENGVWGQPTLYNIRYGITGENTYQETTSTTTSIQLTGLLSNTSYDFSVQSVCGENGSSEWATMTALTPCMPLSLPYTEDFESYTPASSYSSTSDIVMPECWTDNWTATPSSYSNYCPKVTNNYYYQPSTGNYLYFNAGGSSYTYYQNPTIIVLPEFAESLNSAMISFRVRCSDATYGELLLGYVDIDNQFTSLKTITCATAANADLQTHGLNAYTFPQHAKLALKANYTNSSTYSSFAVGIDDIAVELLPSCGLPSIAVSDGNATITPGAGLITPGAYDLQIGNEIQRVYTTNIDLSTVFTLTPNTDYEISVRAVCSETDNSDWSEAVSFRSPCIPLSLPYTEDFESYTPASSYYSTTGIVMPDCWTDNWTVTPSSSNYCPKVTNYYYYQPSTGNYLYFNAGSPSSTSYQNPTIVVLPEFIQPLNSSMISFKARCSNTSSTTYGELLLGYVDADNQFTSLKTITCATADNADLQTHDLSAYTFPQHAKLALKANYTYYSTYSSFAVGIDDIAVELLPTCGTPSIAVSGTTATITPSTIAGTPESYVLNIGNEQQTVPATTPTTVVDLTTIFSLELSTTYEISVKSNCGETDGYSEWSDPVSFTTPACIGAREVTIGTGTATNNYLPTNVYYSYSLSEQIYTSAELGGAAGNITSMSIKSVSVSGTRNLGIYIVHTNDSEFASTSSWIHPTSADLLYSGNVSFTSSEWTTILFDQSFEYDGVSNIVLIIDDNTGTYIGSSKAFQTTQTSTYASLYQCDDYTNFNPMTSTGGTRLKSRNNVIFNFCPIPVVTCGKPRVTVDENAVATIVAHETGGATTFALQIEGISGQQIVHTDTVDLVSLFGLEGNTEYSVSAKAICGEGDESEWTAYVSFTTPCTMFEVPYFEDFEAATVNSLPDCWTIISATDNPYVQSNNRYSYFTTKFLGMNYAAIVATPKLNIPANRINLEFDYTQESTTNANCGPIMVGFTTKLNATAEEINWVDTINNSTNKAVEHHVLNFVQLASTENGYVVFRSKSSNYLNAIDNISITEIPSCGTPSIAVQGGIATITPSEIGGATTFALQIDGINGQQIVDTNIVDLVSLFGLDYITEYSVSVKAICGVEDESEWSDFVPFTTPCAISEVPYFEDFEAATVNSMPDCWTIISASTLPYVYASNNLSYFTTKFLGMNYAAIVATPKLNIPANRINLEFDYTQESTTSLSCGPIMVGFTTKLNATAEEINWVDTINNSTSKAVEHHVLNFSQLESTENGYVVFRSQSSNYLNAIDNISITEIPTCGKPSIAVQGGIATITPSEFGSARTFALQIDGISGQQIVDTNNVDLVSLFGLDYNTAYSVRVKAICGVEDESEWSNFVSFRTPCDSYDLPYTQNFDSYTSSQTMSLSIMPDCWNRLYTGSSVYYGVGIYPDGSSSAYSHSAPNSLHFYVCNNRNYPEYGDAYAVMPSFNTPNSATKVSFYAKNYTSDRAANIEVGIVTDINDIANTFTLVETVTPTSTSTYDLFSISLVNYQGPEGNIAFRMQRPVASGSASVYNGAYIDDIEIIELPTRDLAVVAVSQPKDACEITEPLKVTVKNTGITDAISSFTLTYQVNTTTPVSEIVNLTTALQPGEEYVHTFNNVVYMTGNIAVSVELENDGDANNNTLATEAIEVLDPIAVPYVENFAGVVEGHGWNVTDLNQDGVTFAVNNRISYAYNDTMNANDVIYSPCVELAPGKYNAYFDYNALSNLTESFDFIIKNNATAAVTTLIMFEISGTEVDRAHTVFEITEAGVYEFGFLAKSLAGNMGFVIDNFSVYPIVEVEVAADENGVVNPNGTLEVNYGDDLVLSIMPNTMYHVGGITVDGELVQGEDASNANFMLFTMNNVTEPHNVYVDFKLEFHIIKSVANFKPEYTDVPGWFVPAATDTTNDVNPRTLSFFAAPHYQLYSLEEGLMSTENMTDVTARVIDLGMVGETHEYSFTTDTLRIANYYYKATFRRDTVNIQYNVLTGKGYADASQLLEVGQSHLTWVDYSVAQDVNHTSTFVPYTTGDAHSDYHIVDVTVDGESQGVINDYTFTDITANHNVDIKYGYQVNATVRNYAVSSLGSTELRGTIAPAQQLVAEGDTTIVTGTIQENFHLYNLFVDGVDMINDVVVVENPEGGYYYTYTIDSTIANYNIEAVVKLDTVAIYYHIDGGQGYADFSGLLNEGDNYTTHVNFGDSILSVVAPAPGYSIANYILEGFDMGAIDSYQFNNVRREYYVHLNFVVDDIAIVTNAYGHGTVTEGMNFTYNPETPVNYNFVATPEVGYHIASVMINGEAQVVPVSGSFQYSIENVSEDYTFDVIFEANTYTMTAMVQGEGMINPVGVQTVAYGSNMTYVATANVGSYIATVTVDGQSTSYTQEDNLTTTTIPFTNITANHTVTVVFQAKSYTITANVDENGHGTINNATSVSQELTYGMGYVLNFVPEQGYHVSQILVDGEPVEVADSYQFVDVQANHNVVVSFAINEYTLTATSNVEACTITPAQTTANYGTTVNYTINVATGYHLENVMDNGTEVAVVNNTFSIENISENHVISASFEANTYVVTVNQPAHAVITPGTQTVAYGATPEYVIVPQAGYEVVSVTAGNALVPVTTVNGVGHFTLSPVHANLEINAVVAQATYTITVLPSQGQGTVSPATNQTVTYGSSKTFTFAPATHYVISDIIVDGVSKGALTSYTFVNIVANHTIQAVFEGNCMVPTGLSVNNVTSTSAQLSWSNTGAASYTVRYQAVGETTYHETTANTNSCTINGLTADAIYYWSVKSNCGAGNESEFSNMQQFITEPSNVCGAPTNLTVDEIYNENVRVSWTSNATTFNVRCKRTADDPSTYVYTYGVSGTEFTFNNLFQATTYNWGVQTVCNYATGNLSAWAESTFTTGSTGIATDELSSIKVYSHLNNVYVVNDNGIVIKDVKIYDIYGKLVYTGNATSNPEVIALNVANGNYVVKLDTENGVAVYKLAIIR